MTEKGLTNETVLEAVKAQFGDSISPIDSIFDMLTLEVKRENAHELIKWLKSSSAFQINFLTNIGGVHYPDDAGREFAVVYHLHSLTKNFRIRLKVFLPKENIEVDSVVDIYAGANWMERETYDFFGITFRNHPNMTRILNEDTMDYFPMRKEYHLEDATREDKDNRFFGR